MTDELNLSGFASALRDKLNAGLAQTTGPEDVAATVERARELAPDRVPAGMVEACAELAPVVPLRSRTGKLDLAPFQAAYRARTERLAGERSLTPIPPLRAVPGRRRPITLTLAVAAAAAVLIVAGLAGLSSLVGQGERATPLEAENVAVPTPRSGVAELAAPPSQRRSTSTRSRETLPPAREPGTPTTGPETAPTPDTGSSGESVGSDSTEIADLAARLEDLDRKAEAAWRAGQLDRAQRLLGELVRIGGHHSRVELAFGDLFAIAHGARDVKSQRRHWKQYLRRFPRGRFAGDARAGLCRTAEDDARRCWEEYLRRHPSGTHRREAEGALGEEP